MKYRTLILLTLLATFANMSHAQGNILNCTTGPYQWAGGGQHDNGCDAATTITASYSEWCKTTANTSDGTPAGVTYWGPITSSVTGYGWHTCVVQNYVCWPYMNMYEVDGGNKNPDGSISDSSYNRFYNQRYNTTYSVNPSNHCPQTGDNYQDFQQCPTKQCAPPPPPPPPDRCCQCRMKGKDEKVPTLQKAKSLCCTCDCPIIIDTTGNGFDLTSAAGGVKFDMSGTSSPEQMSWTASGSGNAFLCLPDANGACDDGKDLFGNFTPQPATQTPNGFLALAVYDLSVNGGNGDGVIDSRDAIYSKLRLWIDRNHDGISQPDEIYTLPSLGVYSISLDYKEDRKVDQYGNLFRYRSQLNAGGPPGSVSRTVYDIFLVLGSNTITAQQTCPAPQAPRLLPEGKSRLH